MTIEIKEVEFGSELYWALVGVRYEVLRKPIGMEMREKDVALDHTEFHIGAFDGATAVGCALLRPMGAGAVQLRQVAILDAYQGQRIGVKLVTAAENLAAQKNFQCMETRARKTAQKFYEKLGYQVTVGGFTDEHTLMMEKPLPAAARR